MKVFLNNREKSMQTISLIAAADKNGVIGNNGHIPWHLPADMKYFKEKTIGHSVLMGRKTFQSIGRMLPRRRNVVLTRNRHFTPPQFVWHALVPDFALLLAGEGEVFVIGGAEIYRNFFPQAHKIYMTLVHGEFEGDTFFPRIDSTEWKEISRIPRVADEQNPYDLEWIIYERTIPV